MNHLAIISVFLAVSVPTPAAEGAAVTVDKVTVTHTGIGEAYATAIARTAAAARTLAISQFGFDMPEAVTINVTCDPGQKSRLWTDGRDHFELVVGSEADLRKPADSGIFHLYGMCHETGHLAQYRLVPKHDWMTTAAAEGWAHYLGSRLVDAVYAREGPDLWPDRYDYRADGTARLKRQLASAKRDEVDTGASLWMELAEIVGDKGIAPIFRAWGQAEVDPADPGPALAKALAATSRDPRLAAWWKRAEPVLVLKRGRSAFASRTATPAELAGKAAELSHDDGTSAGKASMTGGGHAVRFDAPSAASYVTAIKVYGSRYGAQQPPAENFHVWLCDSDFKQFADFPIPYSVFDRGEPKWVMLPVRPTLVPEKFIVCVGFDPSGTKGVFVHRDKESGGDSLVGLPGVAPQPYAAGDWMIRVQIDQTKSARRTTRAK